MLTRIFTATMEGLKPHLIEVEVDTTPGIPGIQLIGLLSKSVDEAKERVLSALVNCGVKIRSKRTLINLAPADLRKSGGGLELAIAVGLLKLYGELTADTQQTMFFGELSLDGSVKAIRGCLPMVLAAKQLGFTQVVIPAANVNEIAVVTGVTIRVISHLQELLISPQQLSLPSHHPSAFQPAAANLEVDLAHIQGHATAKRALEIAAAGGHHLLLMGPPGTGKTLLAKGLVGLLPPLTESEAIAVTTIYSVAGLIDQGFVQQRPFRAPHHTTSTMGLIGGGALLRPGEISLAHHGLLFLDELGEFERTTLEALRQPLESGVITLTRAAGFLSYPAQFMLVAASNPCRCGYFGSVKRACSCSQFNREQYQRKFSGPIMDRIDLQLYVQDVKVDQLIKPATNTETTAQIRQRVLAARQQQQQRLQTTPFTTNASLSSPAVLNHCQLSSAAQTVFRQVAQRWQLSSRGIYKVIKVARTIADLAQQEVIGPEHIYEACTYRTSAIKMR